MTQLLYDTDFYQWTVAQASLLRNEEYADLDRHNLIEEIESMGASERRELDSRLTTIMLHLLKITNEPNSSAVRGWKTTILTQRTDLRKVLRNNATLRGAVANFVDDAYQDAQLLAADALQIEHINLPPECPWTAEQLLDLNWLP